MRRRPPRSTQSRSSAASDVYKRQRSSSGRPLPRSRQVEGNIRLFVLAEPAPRGTDADDQLVSFPRSSSFLSVSPRPTRLAAMRPPSLQSPESRRRHQSVFVPYAKVRGDRDRSDYSPATDPPVAQLLAAICASGCRPSCSMLRMKSEPRRGSLSAITSSPVSYTHLTLPTIYS